ncbi:TetR/AcrR family transcriptional regulator [Sandaracinus amylolyticus]|uniref:TetR/AcrR family transcriptional regulator n=1 Tax=Sandaracinus amylolyticus TaxID=927083 RepID=UPI001F2FB85B|nr:TetR/AcrR family transcriptional regulator [Sandaracinus amylolyticus]
MPSAGALGPRKVARQARAVATVEAIHEAAIQLLTEVGYDGLTTTLVAQRAGVSVGTLYQYYGDKHSLAVALVRDYLGHVEAALRGVLEEERSLPTLARHLVRRFVTLEIEHRELCGALRTVFVLPDVQQALAAATGAITEVLAKRIVDAKPEWPASRAREVATMWSTMISGTTGEMLGRSPQSLSEPWFAEALEVAVLALLRG